jgi:hypothetical protein
MSLIPSAVQGAAGDNYFTESDEGFARNLTILPTNEPTVPGSGKSAVFAMDNGGGASPMNVVHYVTTIAGGGLVPGAYQIYMYGPSVGGNNIGVMMVGQGLGNGYTVTKFNAGIPLDATRLGKITGTGALQVIACPSIVIGSAVNLAFVGGNGPPGDVPITIVPNTSFSLTLPLGAVYNYTVVG